MERNNRMNEFPRRGERPELDDLFGAIGCWIYNRETGQYWCSEEITRLYERKTEKIRGACDYYGLIHPEDREWVRKDTEQGLKTGGCDRTYRLLFGEKVKLVKERIRVYGDRGGGSQFLVGLLHEVTDICREQSIARQEQDEFSAINEYLAGTVNTTDIQTIADRACHTVQQALKASMIGVFVWEQGRFLRVLTNPKVGAVMEQQNDRQYFAYRVLKTGQRMEEPVEKYPDEKVRELMQGLGLKRIISIPVSSHGNIIAALSLALSEDRSLNERESAFCRTICGHLSAQLKNALLYRQLEKELTDRKRLESDLDIIFTESIDFISVINVEGYFRRINPLFAEKLGFTEQELLSHPVYDFLHPDDRSDGIRALEEVIRKGTIRGCRLRYRCKTGGTLYLEMNARYVPFSRKIIAIARDITQQRRIEEEKIALEKSMELERLKTEFFSNLSHEFKTPLNIILSSVQLLQMKIERAGDEKDQEYLKLGRYIQQNAYKLLRLTTNMLDSTKLESGYMPIFPERGDIVECLQTIVQSVEPYAAAKKIRLHFSANLRYSLFLLFDPEKVDRILLNLLSNAVKYTPAGGMIRVSVEDTADHVAVSVSDNGPGIAAELLPEIFEKFRVSESGLIRNDEGSGLGLSIAKALVEMHDGEIGVSSPPGEGCTFRFTLSRHLKSTDSEPLHSWMGDGARQSRVYLEMADLNT